jgi:hypothetical protein
MDEISINVESSFYIIKGAIDRNGLESKVLEALNDPKLILPTLKESIIFDPSNTVDGLPVRLPPFFDQYRTEIKR